MLRKIPEVDRLLSTYGSYAKPFLNLALETTKIPPPWKHYFLALKFYWKREYFLSLAEIERGLNKCKDNKTLYYLLLTEKLSLLSKINSKEGEILYQQLKKEFPYIPSYARNIISSSLLHYYATNFPFDLQRFRIWSNNYHLDPSSQVFIFLGKAREEIRRENIRKAISYYFKAFRTSLSIPHPTGIINSLNDASWYLKEKHPKFSLLLAKKAVYYSAWYREDLSYDFAVLDTLFEVQKINNDLSICETSEIINYFYRFLSNSQGKYTKYHYKKLYESSKNFCFNLNTPSYEMNERLLNFFREYKILSGKVLRKIINSRDIKPDFNKLPTELLIELRKKSILDNYQKATSLLKELSEGERDILILSNYTAFFNRKKLFPFIVENLKDITSNLSSKNFEMIKFLSHISNDHPFLKARRDLATKFLENLSPKAREKFISFYLSLKEEEREIIDTFVRNYVRYDRDWDFKISIPYEIEILVKKFKLKDLPSSLAYYCFEKRERKKFKRIISGT
ncbi:hypothetical protein FY122_09370 [Dictyoglomus thermophilum]|uniref:hypothetical protein n=1 Tax=Dictyoglomus thermophilum TaxID=14 RepID=UPI0011EAAADD|nr:hypothetical protein [Dictyoglomus thermophilum]TYT20330.1 hypothetical protein FY122_09370 [Dictyoglomus thermophilum]